MVGKYWRWMAATEFQQVKQCQSGQADNGRGRLAAPEMNPADNNNNNGRKEIVCE